MVENASVGSVDVLTSLESALARTASVVRDSIASISSEARRQLDILSDRCRELQREVDYWQRELDDADDDTDTGRISQKLEETQERLGKARYWLTRAEDAYHNFAKHEPRMMELATERTAAARDLLMKSAEDLRRYLALQPDGESGIGATMLAGLEDGVATVVGALAAEQQMAMAVERLSKVPEIVPGVWECLSLERKRAVMQTVEDAMAGIQGRDTARIEIEDMESGTNGYYDGVSIHVSRERVQTMGSEACVGTTVHEGRHAYQRHAVLHLGYHPDGPQVEEWRDNLLPGHYLDAQHYSYEDYRNQPVESDAFSYRDSIVGRLFNA